MSSTSENHQSKRFADKSAAIASEAAQNGKATADRSLQAFEQSYSTTVENVRNYNLKMIDMAQANIEGVFEGVRQLVAAKTPADIIEIWTSQARKQFEMLSEQSKELTAFGQKVAGESAEPIARGVSRAFSEAS